MRVAALDLGSNTFLCLIADISNSGEMTIVSDHSQVVRLGQGVDKSGEFHPEALVRAKKCLTEYRQIIEASNVDYVLAAATSAARDAKNGQLLFEIGNELNIPIEIIPGSDEARISYAGATVGLDQNKRRLIIDVGGGSTELIVGFQGKIESQQSFDIGAVRLTERFITHQPISTSEQKNVLDYIDSVLQDQLAAFRSMQISEIVAVAGTPTAIAAAELGGFDAAKIDAFTFSKERLSFWLKTFAETSVQEKQERFGLGGRADIIFAGTSILWNVLNGLQIDQMKVSTKGVRYGVALEIFRRHQIT